MAWADVDMSAGTLTFTQAKTGEKVTVPLHSDLLAHLETLAGTDKPDVFIMPHMAGLKPGGRHGLSEGFKRIMRKAGLDMEKVKARASGNYPAARSMRCGTASQARWRIRVSRRNCG